MLYASISTLAIFLSCVFSATLLLLHNHKRPVSVVWSAMSYVIGIWALGLYLTINADTYDKALFWGRFHNYVAILIIPLFVHFVDLLLGKRSKLATWSYVFFVALMALNLIFYERFVASVRGIGDFKYYVEAGDLYWVFLSSYFLFTTLGSIKLALALPKTRGIKRKQFLYVLTAFSIGFVAGGTTFPMVFGINWYPFGLGMVVVYVLLITYAIVHHRVLEVSAFIGSGLASMFTLLFLGGVYAITWQWYSTTFVSRSSMADLIVNLIYLAVACETYFFLRPRIEAVQQRLVLRGRYNYIHVRDKLTAIAEEALEPEKFFSQLHSLLWTDMRFESCHFFVLAQLMPQIVTSSALIEWSPELRRFDKITTQEVEPLLADQVWPRASTTHEEAEGSVRALMELLKADVFVPFFSGGVFLGMAMIKRKERKDHFSADDFLVFDFLSSKVDACLNRIFAHIRVKNVLMSLAGSIAHEVRNPLGQANMSLESIGEMFSAVGATPSAAEIARAIRLVSMGRTAVNRGQQVVDMILASMRMSAVDSSEFTPISAAQATQKAVDEYAFSRNRQGDVRDKVSVHVVQDFTFQGDETAYIFILFNLIKNALYYFGDKADASIVLTVDADKVVVKDNGPGISAEVVPRLFESFMTSGKAEGTGLGLSYCKRTMQSFGGDIACESVVGQCTQFTLSFPALSQSSSAQREADGAVVDQAALDELELLASKTVLMTEASAIDAPACWRRRETPPGCRF